MKGTAGAVPLFISLSILILAVHDNSSAECRVRHSEFNHPFQKDLVEGNLPRGFHPPLE
jgi:hypothetical protein